MNFIFDPSLVLYLPLYELDGGSLVSRDACGHVCTVTGALWRPGGRYFDGTDDRIDIGDNAIGLTSNGITIIAWVKVPNGQAAQIDALFVKGYDSTTQTIPFLIRTNAATDYKIQVMFYNNGYYSSISTTNVADGTWHCIAGVVKGNTTKVYIDGLLEDSDTHAVSAVDNAKPVTIGIRNNGSTAVPSFTAPPSFTNGYWHGDIGVVLVYNRALHLLEMQNIYLATKRRYQ